MPNASPLVEKTAHELLALLHKGEVTSEKLTDDFLAAWPGPTTAC